ncbi:MAG: hypothetical protein M0R49_01060 [Limnochordia bacterium]|nr:hypothetical protein [Limnochordia bacterium]
MDTFDIGETVIASITVKNSSDTLVDPATSMKIEVIGPNTYVPVLAATAMTKDSTGTYHYDIQTSGYTKGTYTIHYISTDSTRITIQTEYFKLE